jgi:hypothetical protein
MEMFLRIFSLLVDIANRANTAAAAILGFFGIFRSQRSGKRQPNCLIAKSRRGYSEQRLLSSRYHSFGSIKIVAGPW